MARKKKEGYEKGDRVKATYNTSVYKPNLGGWRTETVEATLVAVSPKRFKVVSADMKAAGSKRQSYNVTAAKNMEVGKTKLLSSLHDVKTARKTKTKKTTGR